MESLKAIDGIVLANACGPCIGQWKREKLLDGVPNTIVTSYNRNFPRRNDGRSETMNFIASPEIVIALSLAGRLSFNPLVDTLTGADGRPFKLEPPKKALEVPPNGFEHGDISYVPPADDGKDIEIVVDPNSQRLQLMEPFPAWDGNDFLEVPVLIKVKGKCTTDHISPAGPGWRYAATWTSSAITCSWGRSTPTPKRPAKGWTFSQERGARRSRGSRGTIRSRGSGGWWWGTTTTARAAAASTRPCRPDSLGRRRHRAQLRSHPRVEPEKAWAAGLDL